MRHLWDLVDLSDEELGRIDVAKLNLDCAQDLPDAGNIDVHRCISRLDYLAEKAEKFIERRMPQFSRNPSAFNNSESYYRILCLITFLQRDMGIRYHPAKTEPSTPLDTADIFIHGALIGEGGTCGSLPVVHAAIGRRLGYPIKLVETHGEYGHMFCRWDDPKGERFNIEAAAQGLNTYPDDHYRTGKYQLSRHLEKAGRFLLSKTPKQELAAFLGARGHRWWELGVYWRAAQSFAWSFGLDSENKKHWNCLVSILDQWHEHLEQRTPPGFPPISYVNERRYAKSLPREAVVNIMGLEVTDLMLNDPEHNRNWWEPMRKGLTPKTIPVRCLATLRRDGVRLKMNWKRPNTGPV